MIYKKISLFLAVLLIATGSLLPFFSARLASAAAVNLIANPSVETADPTIPSQPQGWNQGGWGANTRSLTYENTGHTGTRSLKVQISSYSSGDAKWYFTPVAVSSNTQYIFNDYYQSNIVSDVVAQFDNGSGSYTYQDLGNQTASSTWTQTSINFVTPATAKNVAIFHLISAVGWVQVDDYSLTAYSVPSSPTVNLTAPSANTTVSGAVQLVASAADSSGVAGVQFKVDGNNVGSEVTAAPYQMNWDTTSVANGSHALTAVARNTSNVTTTSSPVQVTVNNPVAPGSNLISNPSLETPNPSNTQQPQGWNQGGWGTNSPIFTYVTNSGHSGTHSAKIQITSYTNGDAKWYFNSIPVTAGGTYNFSDFYQSSVLTSLVAQFDNGSGTYTYQTLGSAAASSTWNQAAVSFTVPAGMKNVTIFHLITAVGSLQTDDASLIASTVPSASITSPAANATVSGTVQVTASASAASGITSVQFRVDGVNQGPAVTTAPYQMNWDTTSVANGSHALTAVVTSQDNQTATSPSVNVNVSNQTQTSNIVPNPSMETADPTNPAAPKDWVSSSWGTNTTAFTYTTTSGHTGARSLKVQISKYTSGDAKWYFTPQTVSSDTEYTFSDYYQATVANEVDAVFTMPDGSTIYEVIGYPEAAAQWTQFVSTFSVPVGAVDMTVYHLINKVGTLTIDDASMQKHTPVGFNRALVSLTFDDSLSTQYTNGLPLLQKYGFNATFYAISGLLGTSGYMTGNQIKSLYTGGNEIGSHTVTHPNLTSLSASQLTTELSKSQTTLQQILGTSSVNDFAAPYGLVNTNVTTQIQKYYQSERGVEYGFNDKTLFSAYDIKVQDVDIYTTLAQVQDWVKQAQATNTWLVLVYHAIDPNSQSAGQYNTLPTDLNAQLSAIKNSGITVETLAQALAEVKAQL